MTNKQRQSFIKRAINKQFEIAGHKMTYDDCFNIEGWYSLYTITEKQHSVWKKWFIDNLSKHLSKHISEKEFIWFDLMYGLKIQSE